MGTGVHPTLTVGAESDAAKSIEAFGGRHEVRLVTDIAIDRDHQIVSAPAYMYNVVSPYTVLYVT